MQKTKWNLDLIIVVRRQLGGEIKRCLLIIIFHIMKKDNKNGSGLGDVFNAQRKWPKHSGKVPGRAIHNHLTLLSLRPVRINNAVLELARQV